MRKAISTICRRAVFVVVCSILGFGVCTTAMAQNQADLVLQRGKVVTVDEQNPFAEVVAIAEDRILAVGTNEEIAKLIGEATKVVDLNGRLLIPGFIEGHGHFLGLGQSKMMLDLSTANSWDDIVEQVAEAAKTTPAGQWIIGRGWHQSKWDSPPEPNIEGYPTSKQIDAVTPDHPVLLTHASGHMNFANSFAMRLAQVDENTPVPNGGEILTDESGKPIGVFRETAQGLISRARAASERRMSVQQRKDNTEKAIELAGLECIQNGITSFHDAGSSYSTLNILRDAADNAKLKTRLYIMIRDSNDMHEALLSKYREIGRANNFYTVRAIKVSLDGALGPHGAWLLAPYEDMPTSVGLNLVSIESATRTAELAIANDYQYCVHAIGDRANREVLDIYEQLFADFPEKNDLRWRIEHAQHLHPDDIPRFGALGVVASMQGIHCTSDAIFVLQRLGQRRAAEGAYVWQKLISTGALVTNGTDAPVENIDPIACFYATVSRKLKDGSRFFDDQRMSRERALYSYTLANAIAAFEEDLKGSICEGKLADMVVLSKDILTCEEDEIRKAQVDMTILGGQIVYERTDGLD